VKIKIIIPTIISNGMDVNGLTLDATLSPDMSMCVFIDELNCVQYLYTGSFELIQEEPHVEEYKAGSIDDFFSQDLTKLTVEFK